jgi:hypothetical protein
MKERLKEQMNKLKEKRQGRSIWDIRSKICGFIDENLDFVVGGVLVSNCFFDILSHQHSTPDLAAEFSVQLTEEDQAITDSVWTLIEIADLLVATE